MLINLLIALLIATAPIPDASPEAGATTYFDPGSSVNLSPDGSTLAMLMRDELCAGGLGDAEATCVDTADIGTIDPSSITWSPDSTRLAFSLDAFRLMIDSDIFVLDVATGTLTNLTDDGATEFSITDNSQVLLIDVSPAWSPEGTSIVFSRSNWGTGDTYDNDLMRIPADGGEATLITTVMDQPGVVFTTPAVSSDGSVIVSVLPSQSDHPQTGIWRVTASGEMEPILVDEDAASVPLPVLAGISADGTQASVVSRLLATQRPTSGFDALAHLDLVTGDLAGWEEFFTLPTDMSIIWPPAFVTTGEESVAIVTAWSQAGGDMPTVTLHTADGSDELTVEPMDLLAQFPTGPSIEISTDGTILVNGPAPVRTSLD